MRPFIPPRPPRHLRHSVTRQPPVLTVLPSSACRSCPGQLDESTAHRPVIRYNGSLRLPPLAVTGLPAAAQGNATRRSRPHVGFTAKSGSSSNAPRRPVCRTRRNPRRGLEPQSLPFIDPADFERWCEDDPIRFEHPLLHVHLKRDGDELWRNLAERHPETPALSQTLRLPTTRSGSCFAERIFERQGSGHRARPADGKVWMRSAPRTPSS